MYYLLPLAGGYLAYKFRYELGLMLLKTITKIEISYNKWYKLNYGNNSYKILVNGVEGNVVDYSNSNNIYTIEYSYKNKVYRIVGDNLEKLTDYVENVENRVNDSITYKTYRWISAIDNDENCYLDEIKKLAGPLGDFYIHANLVINPKHIDFMSNNEITITDFRLDNFIIKDSILLN